MANPNLYTDPGISTKLSDIAGYLILIETQFEKERYPIGPEAGWETYINKYYKSDFLSKDVFKAFLVFIFSLAFLLVVVMSIRSHKDADVANENARAAGQAAILINGGAATAILAFLA